MASNAMVMGSSSSSSSTKPSTTPSCHNPNYYTDDAGHGHGHGAGSANTIARQLSVLPSMVMNAVMSPAGSTWERWRRLAELFQYLLMLALYLWLWTVPSLFLHLFTPPAYKNHYNSHGNNGSKRRSGNTPHAPPASHRWWISGPGNNNDPCGGGVRVKPRFLEHLGAADLRSTEAAPGRALFEILRLMSEMPVASPKYEFARKLADSIIHGALSGSASSASCALAACSACAGGSIQLNNNVGLAPNSPARSRAYVEMALLAAFERSCRLLMERMERVEEELDLSVAGTGADGCGGGALGLVLWWLWTISPPPVWAAIERIIRRPWRLVARKATKLLSMSGGIGGGGDRELDHEMYGGMVSAAALLRRVLEEANLVVLQCLKEAGVEMVPAKPGPPHGHGQSKQFKEEYETSYRRERRRQAVEVAEMMTEKAAHEVLWLAQMLRDCAASGSARTVMMHEALVTWSLAGRRLPSLCLRAPLPRVQASLIRVCGLLFKELNHGTMDDHARSVVTDENNTMSLKAKLLLMWLPLFCNARSTHDIPSFSANEKSEILLVLEHTIASLPFHEQEIVLSCWLQLYTRSPFDWPNLQHSFETWLCSHRIAPY